MNILVTYIATKQYKEYEKLFKDSLDKFYPGYNKIFHTFTDVVDDPLSDGHTYINDLPWPLIALMKFKYIKSIIDSTYKNKVDYIFNFDSNMRFNEVIDSDMICDKLIAIPHHYWTLYPNPFEYFHPSKLLNSNSYLDNVKVYVNSGIFGGPIDLMSEALDRLIEWTEDDLKRNIIPQWHDESYWNKYVELNSDKVKILDQCYNVDEYFKEELKVVDRIKIGRFIDKSVEDLLDSLK